MTPVRVEAGWFWMGWEDGPPAERPRHLVWVDAFEIATAPVTRAEYAVYLQATGRPRPPSWDDPRFADPRQPVVAVTWEDAAAYCDWLGARDGRACRLPTEAEWEKAARGGLEGARFPWGDAPPPATLVAPRRPLAGPPPVGQGPSNGFGLTDLTGVVHEWCLDWHDEASYTTGPRWNPRGPATGTRRVSRGGAWRHQDPFSPVAHRSSLPPHLRYTDYGFRVAADSSGPRQPVPPGPPQPGADGDRSGPTASSGLRA